MPNGNETPTEPQTDESQSSENAAPETPKPFARFRTKRWMVGGGIGAAVILALMGNCLYTAVPALTASTPVPTPTPPPVVVPTPTPITALIPDRPTPTSLPSQYAFVHFVNEMTACYEQRDLPYSTVEKVEADIMLDVPLAINELLKLYAAQECREVAPWYQIPGRVGWLLRGSGVGNP